MTNDYISREAAIIGLAASSLTPHQIDDAAEALQLVPAADVAPVRHGRWSEVEHGKSGVLCECSACKEWMLFYYGFVANYCPNCGARCDL